MPAGGYPLSPQAETGAVLWEVGGKMTCARGGHLIDNLDSNRGTIFHLTKLAMQFPGKRKMLSDADRIHIFRCVGTFLKNGRNRERIAFSKAQNLAFCHQGSDQVR